MKLIKQLHLFIFFKKMYVTWGIVFFALTASAKLEIESVYPTMGVVEQEFATTLHGKDFTGDTLISIFPDVGNRKFVFGSVDTPGYAMEPTHKFENHHK